jgi:hypothetical protein
MGERASVLPMFFLMPLRRSRAGVSTAPQQTKTASASTVRGLSCRTAFIRQ